MSFNPFAPAHKLAAAIRQQKIGSLELLNAYLKRVERFNPALNAVVVLDIERAKKQARAADRMTLRGESSGPLHGVPMTIKESFDMTGLPSTWGRVDMKQHLPAADADAVKRYRAAGAVIFGKTNVPAMLADWQTFNPVYGTTNNPWDMTRGPGGSSGGSAAALAAGLTALETGSDIGASIRDPSHYCGVYGHKSTYGLCSIEGHALPAFASPDDIAVAGPLARSARDLEIALGIMAGGDDVHSRGWRVNLQKPVKKHWKEFKVAVLTTAATAPVDMAVQHRIQAVADFLAKAGAKVSDNARPDIDLHEAHQTFILLLRAATARNLSQTQFRGIQQRAAALAPKRDDYEAWMLRGCALSHYEWLQLHEKRYRMQLQWEAFFKDCDFLLCPTATTTAFVHNQKGERWERMIDVNGQAQPTTTQLFWAGYSGMAYLPSTVAPAGLTPAGLPSGVQIIGPQYGDLLCIDFAKMLEKEFAAFQVPPGYA
ncbi:MAG: amidase [Limnohabitans sp.]|nr:amidase [Limnohabitans sp.]